MPNYSQGGVVTLTQGTTNTNVSTIASQLDENRNDASTPTTRLPMLPSLLSGRGAEIVVSILSMARAEGWANSLCHGRHIGWFEEKYPLFNSPGGILSPFRQITCRSFRRKFKEAELNAKLHYNNRGHQNNADPNVDETQRPPFCNLFFEFFQYVEERTQNLNNARQQRHRNVQVNRSVISQQAALTTTNRVTINETNAPAN